MLRRIKIFIIFVLVFGGGYAAYRFIRSSSVPLNFVNLSNQSASDIDKINELDKEGDYTAALNLTTDVIRRSAEIRDRAVELSAQMEKMIKALSEIDNFDARQAALEAISSRLALLSRLINYSGYLGQLLDVLRGRFTGVSQGSQEVQTLVDQINSEVAAINNFNSQAAQAMDRFDKIVNQ